MATFDVTIQRGLKALELAKKYAAELDARLPAGHAAYLQASLEQLGASVPGQKAAHAETRQAGQTQHDAFSKLLELIGAIRTSVRNDDDATAADKKEYAIGTKLNARAPTGLLAAAAGIIRVARAKPQRAQELGLLPSDIAQLEALHATAAAANSAEDASRAAAPTSTKLRNTAKSNVDRAVKKIGGAGVVACALEPATRQEFEALLESPR
ncbi:MAG: hypothetical protein ACO1OB_32335, partial [Archangium sp.]